MEKPSMILFDYGGTLAREPAPDFLRGWRAVFQHMGSVPEGVTPEQAFQLADTLWQRFSASRSLSAARKGGFEPHEWQQLRTVLDALGLESALPLPGLEQVLMENASPCEPTPYIEELLAHLEQAGIPSGVISNIGWSGQALSHRLERLFPFHHFSFVLVSSEYGIRKPDPLLFQIAARKAGVPPSRIWFCGDNLQADIAGAHEAGLFPVWYRPEKEEPAPAFPHLAIQGWQELPALLAPCGEQSRKS